MNIASDVMGEELKSIDTGKTKIQKAKRLNADEVRKAANVGLK